MNLSPLSLSLPPLSLYLCSLSLSLSLIYIYTAWYQRFLDNFKLVNSRMRFVFFRFWSLPVKKRAPWRNSLFQKFGHSMLYCWHSWQKLQYEYFNLFGCQSEDRWAGSKKVGDYEGVEARKPHPDSSGKNSRICWWDTGYNWQQFQQHNSVNC